MMVKYVDCEKAKEMFNRYFHNLQGSEAQILLCDMKQAFLELPTADVQEVRHGRWVNESRLMYGPISAQCSVCELFSGTWLRNAPYKHCPHCGAKMDQKE